MEVVSILAFAESMYGPDSTKHLEEAYFLAAAFEAAKRWLESKRTRKSSIPGKKPPGAVSE